MTATATKLTYDDYAKLPDDGKRYEVIDGELFVNPAPVPRHQLIVVNLIFAFRRHANDHASGTVLTAPIDVVFSSGDVVQPDVAFVKTDRATIIGPTNLQGPPHLVVEVLSSGNRRHDEIRKRRLYEKSGVDEYWIVDAEVERVTIYRVNDAGKYAHAAEFYAETGGTITSPLLPGFELPIADVFA